MTEIGGDKALRERIVAATRDLMLIPGSALYPADLLRGLEYIENHLDLLEGVRITMHERGGLHSLLALPEGVREAEVLLNAHLDVVGHPAREVYHSSVRDGRIYGPGAGDMKGQLAILLALFQDMHHQHPGISLGMLITTDEESGGANGMGYFFGELGLRCGAMLIPDGGSLHEVTVEEKGLLILKLRCEGASAHAARPWLARNPIAQLSTTLEAIAARAASWRRTEDTWYPTCTPTIFHCLNESSNRVPDAAEAVLDVRLPPPWTVERMVAELRPLLAEGVVLEILDAAGATHLAPDPGYLRAIEAETGTPAELVRSDGASDARFVTPHDIPVMMSRPLVGNLHTVDEWIDIASMETFYRYSRRYLEAKLVGPRDV